MKKQESDKTKSRLGLILPISDENISNYFIVILDEDNKLWYASKNVVENKKDLSPFGLVFFRFNEESTISYVWCCDKTLHCNGTTHRAFLDPFDSQFDSIDGIPVDEVNYVQFDFDEVKDWVMGRYKQYSIVVIGYFLEGDETILKKRYFLEDDEDKSYREITGSFLEVLAHYFRQSSKRILPIDGKKINEICEIVKNFNPYEVFESYRIEIKHQTISRVGRDDYYYEYKAYSISYIDDYLHRWFSNKEIELHRDSGYTSHFETVNEYERFYEEEAEAKKRAYAEYNTEEHLDCLMAKYYSLLRDRMDKIESGEIKYSSYDWIPSSLNVKRAYNCLAPHLEGIYNYYYKPSDMESHFATALNSAIKQFNE